MDKITHTHHWCDSHLILKATDLSACGGTCQFCPSRVRAQNILQVLIPRLQLCTTQRPHARGVRRGQV